MFKKKITDFAFLGLVGHFFVFFFLVFKKKNVGSVGLRQYNNFFFGLSFFFFFFSKRGPFK